MDNNKVETLKKVLDLEIYIKKSQNKLSGLHNMSFSSAPQPPVCQKINKTYPDIKAQIKFNWIIALAPLAVSLILARLSPIWGSMLIILSPIWIVVYYFAIYRKQKAENIEQIKNSAEYKAQCAEIDAECDKKQAIANQKYEEEKILYETETLPNYQKKLDEWTAKHEQQIKQAENDLSNAQQNLSLIYQETKIVPSQYRTIEALKYIYDMVSTSDYDVTYAIDSYDKQKQRILDEARLREQQLANQLADEQAQLLIEQNAIAEKARRDANIASAVGTIQRHNTNKILKSYKK